MTDQFIDAYSDDQIFIHMLDNLIEQSATESGTPDYIKVSSCCRLAAVLAIGSIDSLVVHFSRVVPGCEDLADFAKPNENRLKLKRLKEFLLASGITVEDDVLEDYLAVKYIRNAYVHSNWSEGQKAFVASRGFPSDVMSFEGFHFERIKKTHIELMNYVGMATALRDLLSTRVSV